MSLKIRIFALMLAILSCLSFAACGNKNDGTSDYDTPGDEYSGNISKDDENKDNEDTELPIDPADDGDPQTTVTLKTADELLSMKRKGSYVLGANIDLSGVDWTPIGTYGAPFEGTLDGAGYKITGLKVNTAIADIGVSSTDHKYYYYGLFGVTNGATVKNIKFENAEIIGSTNEPLHYVYAGIIAGLVIDTEITDCTFSGKVEAESSNAIAAAGAVAGMSNGSSLKSCTTTASVKTKNSPERAISGGFLGYSRLETVIEDCTSKADISASSTIGVAYAGGISGYAYSTAMTRCGSDSTVYAEVTASSPDTGAIGAAHAAGITAVLSGDSQHTPVLTKCYATSAKISAYSNENAAHAAGLVSDAKLAKFDSCYSRATLEAKSLNDIAYVGGLFSAISAGCEIKSSYFAGASKIDSPNPIAGVICASTIDESSITLTGTSYRTDAQFVINGETFTKSTNKEIRVLGTARGSNVFNSFSLLCEAMSWNEADWKWENGAAIPVK